MKPFLKAVSPLRVLPKPTMLIITAGTLASLLLFWVTAPTLFMPTPSAVMRSLGDLWTAGLGAELYTSYLLNLQAVGVAILVSLSVSYLSTVPLLNPLVRMSTTLRFLSMTGLSLAFQLVFTRPQTVKVMLLTFSISVWFILGMLDVIDNIPPEQTDLARTLRMGQWRVWWEVVVLGTADKAFDVLRQTAAMGWMMLTLVESIGASAGGVGVMLQNLQKHQSLAEIAAVQFCIMAMGFGQDSLIRFFKKMFCPYATARSK